MEDNIFMILAVFLGVSLFIQNTNTEPPQLTSFAISSFSSGYSSLR